MITEDYVSFETAKLLKEKGFDEFCRAHYDITNGNLYYEKVEVEASGCEMHNSVLAPTLQMTMKWLREVHDLHIIVYPWKADREGRATHWCCQVYKSFYLLGYEKYTNEAPKSYEEACEAAIKYCLEKLI